MQVTKREGEKRDLNSIRLHNVNLQLSRAASSLWMKLSQAAPVPPSTPHFLTLAFVYVVSPSVKLIPTEFSWTIPTKLAENPILFLSVAPPLHCPRTPGTSTVQKAVILVSHPSRQRARDWSVFYHHGATEDWSYRSNPCCYGNSLCSRRFLATQG